MLGLASIWQVDKHEVASGPLDQRADRGLVAGANNESGSGDALLRPRPLRTVCKQLFTAHGSSKPQGLAVRRRCKTRQPGGSNSPLTKGVEETEPLIVR